jgi:Flp pilus assembly protein protease CpaA
MLYLGYDDIYRLIMSYWIIPVLLFFSAYGVLLTMGQSHLLTYGIYFATDFIKSKMAMFR